MMRSVLVLGIHSCQTLSLDAVSLSMVTSTAPTLGRIITARHPSLHHGSSCGVETEDRPTQTDLAENGGDRPTTNEPWPGVSQTMCTGQSGMATTHDNGYVHDKPPEEEEEETSSPSLAFCQPPLHSQLLLYKPVFKAAI